MKRERAAAAIGVPDDDRFDITFFDRCAFPKTRDVNTGSHLSHLIEPRPQLSGICAGIRPFLKCHRSLTLSSHSLGHSTRRVWHTSCREAPAAHQSTIARRYKYLNALPPSRHRDRVGCLRRLHLQRRPPDDWLRLRAPPAPRAARYPPIRTMGKVRQLPLTPPRRRTARSSPQQRGAGEAEQNDESPPQSPIQAHPRRTARSHWHGTVCC